ncbi:hypothetical protein B566_EDAN006949 [Ephemera danica]|nr:hypothetical protein B566_EDAN006949 [Ephemera danica]
MNKFQGQFQSGSLLVPRPSHIRQMRRSTGNTSMENGSGNASPARRRTVFMDNNLYVYQQMLKMTDKHMENAINRMPLRKVDQWFNNDSHVERDEEDEDNSGEEPSSGPRRISRIHPIFLKFENFKWEWPFLKQPDPLFKFYLGCSLFVIICMVILQFLVMASAPTISWAVYSVSLVLLLVITPSSWAAYLWNRHRDPHNEMERIPSPENGVTLGLYTWAQNITSSVFARFMLYLMVFIALSLSALSNLLHVTEAFSLALLSAIVFLRVHFLLKLVCTCILVSFYTWAIWDVNFTLFMNDGETTNPGLDARISHTMYVWFLAICIHFIDRQADYMNRLDYCWKRQLMAEQEEASNTRIVNKMLLQNILPVHVAEVYLNMNRAHDELFHEEYESVAVVFASLVGYSLHDDEGAEEDGLHDDGMGGLTLLNEIITDFDKLLFEPQFARVEKIKVAGFTYMAACGLQPGRRDSNASYASSMSRGEPLEEPPSADNALVLIKFAARMMAVLKAFNKDALQTFSPLKLRVGICHGHVMAGVVGEKKPLYDIWGDTVNMASRMDSTAEAGKIQVLESTARLLESQGIKCERRGMTFVKGKGQVLTYYVPVDEEFHLLSTVESSASSLYESSSDHETSL